MGLREAMHSKFFAWHGAAQSSLYEVIAAVLARPPSLCDVQLTTSV